MAKKAGETKDPENKEPDKVENDIDDKVQKKVDKVEKEINNSTGERVNVIGEIKNVEKPDPENADEVKVYFKKIDEKLSQLLDFHKPPKTPDPEPTKTPEEKSKRRWYDKEII